MRWAAREKSLEILRHGWELNPGHGEDRQWAIPLSYWTVLKWCNWGATSLSHRLYFPRSDKTEVPICYRKINVIYSLTYPIPDIHWQSDVWPVGNETPWTTGVWTHWGVCTVSALIDVTASVLGSRVDLFPCGVAVTDSITKIGQLKIKVCHSRIGQWLKCVA